MGPRFKVSPERLEKSGIEPTTPDLQCEKLYDHTTETSSKAWHNEVPLSDPFKRTPVCSQCFGVGRLG